MNARAIARTLFVLVISTYTLAVTLPDIALPWHPFSTFGYSTQPQSGTITWVDADARSRGLRVGDAVDITRLPAATARGRVLGPSPLAPPGTTVDLPLRDGRVVTVISHEFPRSALDNFTDVLQMIGYLLAVVIASVLVLMRPAPATWAFYVFEVGFSMMPAQLTREYASDAFLLAMPFITVPAFYAAMAALVSFALRFPNATPSRGAQVFERALIFGVTPISVVAAFIMLAREPIAMVPAGVLGFFFAWVLPIVATIILLARYVTSPTEERGRLQWIVASFAVAFVPGGLIRAAEQAGIFPTIWAINVSLLFQVVAPAAVAYTVFKHRLFDIRFIVSRALLYATLTSIMIVLLALVDWGLGRWLAESRFAVVIELIVAVGIGVLLTMAHSRIEHFLNNVIFRGQALAMIALRRFAHETDLIADPNFLLQQTGEALRARLESDYVAIYTIDGSSYSLAVTPQEGGVPGLFAAHDLAVLRLRKWHEPFECEEPGHPLWGALLLPMTARGQLVGFVACGPKRDRTHYLPNEVDTLSMLVHRTGSAYALLTLAVAGPPPMNVRRAET